MRIHPAVAAYFGESGKLWRMLGVRVDPDSEEAQPAVRARPRAGVHALSVKRYRAACVRRQMQKASRRRNRP